MRLSGKVLIPAHVMSKIVGDEIMLLDLSNGTYFALDAIGADIWRLLERGMTLGATAAEIYADYDASLADIERDVVLLVDQLATKQLLEVV